MSFEITFIKDRAYYEEFYKQFLEIKLLRKLEPYLATVIIAIGITLELLDNNDRLSYFPIIFTALGIYELLKALTKKSRWMKGRMKDKTNGEPITIKFNEEVIEFTGPLTNGEINYQAFEQAKHTKYGLSIVPSKGNSIFIPNQLFETTEQIDWLTNKLRKST